MPYYRLLNERSVEKALTSLLSFAGRQGTLDDLPDMVKQQNVVRVKLGGFNLFMGDRVRPYTWFLPKVKVGIAEALRMYEDIACNPALKLDTAGNLASHLYPRDSAERKLFTRFSTHEEWLSPALLFAACCQHLGVEIENAGSDSVALRLGNGMIQVSPRGMWSNSRRTFIDNPDKDFNTSNVITYFPPIETGNTVLKALWELADGTMEQYAVTATAHAIEEGSYQRSNLLKIARLEHPIVDKIRKGFRDPVKASAALCNCDKILDDATEDVLEYLYDAAVPDLMSRKMMQSRIPAPTQIKEGRIIREETIESWRAWLHEYYEENFSAIT